MPLLKVFFIRSSSFSLPGTSGIPLAARSLKAVLKTEFVGKFVFGCFSAFVQRPNQAQRFSGYTP